MAQKISKKYNLSVQGILDFDGDVPIISIEDRGEFALNELLRDFNEREIKLSVSFDEEYVAPETDENGEILD